MAYTRTHWKDHYVDANGNVVQYGTPVNATNLNNMEEGIEDMQITEEELDEILSVALS